MLTPSKKLRQTFFAQPSSTWNDWPIDCDTQLHTPIFRPWHWNRKMVRLSGPFYGGLPALFRFASYYFLLASSSHPRFVSSLRTSFLQKTYSGWLFQWAVSRQYLFFLSFVLRQQKHCRSNITHTWNTYPKNEKTACRDYGHINPNRIVIKKQTRSFSRDLPRRIWPPHEGCRPLGANGCAHPKHVGVLHCSPLMCVRVLMEGCCFRCCGIVEKRGRRSPKNGVASWRQPPLIRL